MRGRGFTSSFVCLLALCLLTTPLAHAQTQTGTINGTVTDPNGDPLPGVTVTLSEGSVMGAKTAVTSASGGFRFPALLPDDDYRLTFELDSFQRIVREGVIVPVGQTITLNVGLQLAEMAAEITVTGETPMVDVTSATVSSNFGAVMLENLPNSRQFQDAVSKSPGLVDDAYGGVNVGQAWSSKGGGSTSNEIGFDGVANSSPVYHTSDQQIVYEAIEEVQVVTGALPAELGNVGGAYINVVTKSGGNEFRGEGAVYYVDESLQSDNLSGDLEDQGLDATGTITDYTDYSFNVGGPIARDKLWFNVGYRRYDVANMVSGFPVDNQSESEYYLGKLVWQPGPSHNVYALYSANDLFVAYDPANEFYTVDATWQVPSETEIFKLKWTGILSENTFLEADVATAIVDSSFLPNPAATHTYLELATGVYSGSAFIFQNNKTQRDQAKAALSWFKDDLAGSHDFKFGLDYEKSTWDGENFKDSPVYIHGTYFAFPYLAYFASYPSTTINELEGVHLFAQDSWRISDRVTLNLGFRYNTWQGSYPAQGRDPVTYGPNVYLPGVDIDGQTLFDWTAFEPRLAAVIALDGAGTSVLRLGLNRYHHAMMMGYMILGNPNALSATAHLWYDLNANYFADPDELTAPILAIGGGSVDPNTTNPYTDEITIGFEQELFTDFSLAVNVTWREDAELIDLVNPAETEDSFMPVDIVDPGPDGIPGTGDDGTLTVFNQIADFASPQHISNIDLAKRDYKGIELIANKRLSGKWQAMASLVWQEGTGTMGTDFNNSKGWSYAFDDPNKLINLDGPLTLDREWQLKLMGTWLAPAGFFVSGYWSYQTGYPLFRYLPVALNQGTINVVVDPRDTYRNDDLSRLDLRVEKVFSFGARPTELGLILDVFNTFNESGVTARSGNTVDGFKRPLAVQAPRTLRFGARVRF